MDGVRRERRQALEIARQLIRQAGYALMDGDPDRFAPQLPGFEDPVERATVGSSLLALANINFNPPTRTAGGRHTAGGTGHQNERKSK